MSDSQNSKENSIKDSHKSKNTVALYLVIPVLFAAALLIILSPLIVKAEKTASQYIAVMKEKFSADEDDMLIFEEDYIPSAVTGGDVKLDKGFIQGEKIGTITCENAGINTSVYYGSSIAALGAGAALDSEYSLFGGSGAAYVEGLNSAAFKGLENVFAGDIIKVITSYGVFEYKALNEGVESAQADLVLSTGKSKASFENSADDKIYIAAVKISGPNLIEEEALNHE